MLKLASYDGITIAPVENLINVHLKCSQIPDPAPNVTYITKDFKGNLRTLRKRYNEIYAVPKPLHQNLMLHQCYEISLNLLQ